MSTSETAPPASPVPASPAAARLRELWGEIRNVESAQALLEWDQETQLPRAAGEGRGKMLGTLAAMKHRLVTAPELREVVDRLAEETAEGGDGASPHEGQGREAQLREAQLREARRTVERTSKVPEALAAAIAEAQSLALGAWQEARAAEDFSVFEPRLVHLVDLKRQEAACLAPEGPVYDVLLDEFEPGAREEELVPLFADLKRELAPLLDAVAASGLTIDESPALGHFPAEAQQRLARQVAAALGFDFAAGRLDTSAHPFCTGIHPRDVRMTSRWPEDDFRPAFFGVMHETGHGLYEQGLPLELHGSPAGAAVSLAVHESQSRLWENHVGRSRAFWRWALPELHAAFPATSGTGLDELWPALHRVERTLIRVEADEATYNLHVLARFEIERELFGGVLEVADLPERWDDLYEEVLGVRAGRVTDGVLQDIHWALGAFGYFPTYTLGTLAAAQFFATAEEELGGLDDDFAAGRFDRLLGWLREKVHRRASLLPAGRLIEEVTGRPLAADDFLAHLRGVTAEAYGLDLD